MLKLMEKRDWIQTVANVGAADKVWSDMVVADSGDMTFRLPEGGVYQVICVRIENKPKHKNLSSAVDMIGYGRKFREFRTTEEGVNELREDGVGRLKVGSMKDEICLPEDFDQKFEEMDSQVVAMFEGAEQ